MRKIIIGIALVIVAFVVSVSARNILSGNAGNILSAGPRVDIAEVPLESAGAPATDDAGEQVVKLTYENYQYRMTPSTLKKGVPVRMEVDLDSVTGCMVAVRIPGFGVAKNVEPGDNIITFTPDKAGTFQIACSMGMGRNTFTVVDDSGSAGTYTEQLASAGGSCGMPSGGCGCGGGK
jgi:heme/copper-type cytochrome/quinol oxidase subunit 2